ncbi:rhomboid family intramembrane serine protease [Myceligenerans xiligouense]|uniref:rhomboid family intramembrane serine protease n=1 Tax=Myceligenerans xiligouense TaxID=253184 RepID=UPI001FEB8A49|nr:rhomboid family intramembrane serine protease [Myceligenerans xiligouense]
MDCVKQAAKQVPRQTTVMGGTARAGRPVITLGIIVACVASWIVQVVPGSGWTQLLWFWPVGGYYEPWRFVTAAFVHSSTIPPLHLLFNMFALWIMGQFLEPLLGRARFSALCFVSAVGGSVGVLLAAFGTPADVGSAWYVPVVGASGMVFGLFGAAIPVLRRMGRSAVQMWVLIAINAVLGFVIPNVSWQGHLGGLVTGLAIGAAFAFVPRRAQRVIGVVAPAGVLLLLVLATVAKYEFTLSPALAAGLV